MKNVLIVVIAAMMLVGCANSAQKPDLTKTFIGGNVALNLYYQNGAPPPNVYDGGKFPFGVNIVVENNGESDVGPGTENPYVTARLEGILPANFGVTDNDLKMTLQERVDGAHKNFDGTILGGRVTNFVFPQLAFQGKLQGNDHFTIRGTVCYDYSNTATAQICMKNDIVENVQDSTICTLTGQKDVQNSGGPIHITNLIQNPLGPNKIQVNFRIEHVGPGEFYGRAANEDCNPSIRNTDKYVVGVAVGVTDPGSKVTCYRLGSSNGSIVMYNGAPADISCTVEHTGSASRIYTDTMTIKTLYRYGQFIEQPIIIQSVPS